MAIKLKKEDFAKIDSAFAGILYKKKIKESVKIIEDTLSESFGMTFTIEIMKPKRNAPFYIMSIFPEESTVDKLIQSILNEESDSKLGEIWKKNTNWHIEIDNRILTGSFVDASAKEMTALLLHECGHVIYSNSIPQRMAKVMKYEYAKANIGTKKILQTGVFKNILKLPILKACIFENYRTEAEQKKELKADVFAVKMGYGEYLDSVLTKIIATSSINKETVKHIDQDSGKVYDQMKSDTLFSINTIENLKERKAEISKKNMQKLLLDMPSDYISKSISSIKDSLFKSKYNKSDKECEKTITESAEYLYESAYMTEAFAIFKKKMKRIDPSIVDYINIRKTGMKTNDDKLMLVSYIHGKIDLIDYYLDIMENPKYSGKYIFQNTRNELLRMRKDLEISRQEILAYRIPETRYGVQIMYPDGYEG